MFERHDRPRPTHPVPRSPGLRLVAAAATLAAAAACGSEPTATQEDGDLETLRTATTRFQNHGAALDAQYKVVFLDACMVDESAERRGGMGFHYVNVDLVDGKVDVSHPEALLYEPTKNGQLQLVGVEYVIPKDAWTGARPPRLFGRDFTLNAFDLWALHVWIWKDNPSGLYADWNPRVSCEHAAPAARMSHH